MNRSDIVGKRVKSISPETESHWLEAFEKVAKTGEPLIFENYRRAFHETYEVQAFKLTDNQVSVVFTNISLCRKTEEASRK